MSKSMIILLSLLMFVAMGCGDHADVQVTISAPKTETGNYAVTRVNANLLKSIPKNELDKPIAMMMLNQGDQITILETKGQWVRVQHVLSGRIGWLNRSLVQIESRSKWWSGDTDKARQMAEKIYKDKIFLQRNWPVIHISIEERWNKAVLTVKDGVDFPKSDAEECAGFIIDALKHYFPNWRDHQVFISARWNNQAYSMVMSDQKQVTFF